MAMATKTMGNAARRLAMSALMAICALTAMSQIRLGLKAGTNLHEVDLGDFKHNFSTSNRYGFFVGPTLDFSLPLGWGLEGSLLYENRKVRLSNSLYDEEQTFHHITLPINARYSMGLGDVASIFFFTGPQFSYNVSDRNWDFNNDGELLKGWGLRNSDLTWNVGVGVALFHHFRLAYNYNLLVGADEEYKHGFWIWDNDKKYSWQRNAHQVSLTYLF